MAPGTSAESIQDYFGELISRGWTREDAIKAVAESTRTPDYIVEMLVYNRG